MAWERGHIPWNKGLTAKTDKRMEKMRQSNLETFRNGRVSVNKGKKLSEEHKRKISESERGKIVSKETREKIRKIQTGRKLTPEWKRNLAISIKKNHGVLTEKGKQSIIKKNKALWRNPEFRKKMIKKRKKYKITEKTKEKIRKTCRKKEYREKQREIMKERFKNEEFLKKWQKSMNRKPNKPEKNMIYLFRKFNLPYKYVGDYSFWINGKNPDFLNVNGEKKVIELFGEYWHTKKAKETPKQRINHYKKYGFDCLIIWEKELHNTQKIIETIRSFDNNG